MDDAYLYPRDSMSSDATMRMSVNSLDSAGTAGGRGQIHANLAFALTPEHDVVSPLSLKDPKPSYIKSAPPLPKDNKPSKLSSVISVASHRSEANWNPELHQSRQNIFDGFPSELPSPSQQPRSFGVFQPSLSVNAGEVKSALPSDARSSAATPKGLNGPDLTVSGVQLRSKPSMRKEDRERSHLYEELPWAEREEVAAAAIAAAVAVEADGSSRVKERRRANPLYGERSSTDALPSKPDSTPDSQLDTTSALSHRLQQHCCIFSSLIVALAAIAIAALIVAILAATSTLHGGTQSNSPYSNNATDLLLRVAALQAQVLALKATIGEQELQINDFTLKLNITSSAFSKCRLSESRAIKISNTETVYDTTSAVIVGAFCNGGALVTTASIDVTNAAVNGYQCQCSSLANGCTLLYWTCPTRLF